MTPLIPIWVTTLLPERTYVPAAEDALEDRFLTWQHWSLPRPIPVGIVYLGQYVSVIANN